MRKLNLGCGKKQMEGWVNIDIRDFGQEIIRDITRGLPFDDSSVDEISASHSLEHIERKDIDFVWEEIYRVLKPGAIVFIRVPHSLGSQVFMMDHLSYWNENTVEVLCNKWGSEDHFTKTNFQILQNEKVDEELHIKLKAIKL